MFNYYVYAYIRDKDSTTAASGTPYYIGKGKGHRAYQPHTVTVPIDHSNIVFLETNLSEIGAYALERRYIRWFGRKKYGDGILHNIHEGGPFGKERTSTPQSDLRNKVLPLLEKREQARKNRLNIQPYIPKQNSVREKLRSRLNTQQKI